MSDYDQASLISLYQPIFIDQCLSVSICALLVYDAIITSGDEVKHFWTRRWYSLTHILFFVNRYIGLLSQISILFLQSLNATTTLCNCLFSIWTLNIGNILSIVIIDYILMTRVVALWGNNKTLSNVLKVLISCEATVKIALVAKIDIILNYNAVVLGPGIAFCGVYPDNELRIIGLELANWSTTLSIGLILLILALYKVIGQWRSLGIGRSGLLGVMVKDQIIYYFVVIFCCVVNIVANAAYATVPTSGAYVLGTLGNPAFLCLLGSRMFINLKEVARTEVNDGSTSQASIGSINSSLNFASPDRSASGGQGSTVISNV